jgi:hypothetical protein
MKEIAKIIAVGIIPFLMQGCTGTSGSSNAVNSSDTPPAAQTPPPSQPTPPVTPVATNTTFANNNGGDANSQFSGLIAATNSEQRVQTVVKGRNDPFAIFPVAGKLKKVESEETKAVNSKKTETAKNESKTNNTVNSSKKTATPNTTIAIVPKKLVNIPSVKPVAPNTKKPEVIIPQPDLARSVEISGIIDIDGTAIAIIKLPNDGSSQYVEAGQYIAGGQILVKQIISYPEARVVLQQVGIKGDVVKGLNENSPVAQNDRSTASFLSVENLPQ